MRDQNCKRLKEPERYGIVDIIDNLYWYAIRATSGPLRRRGPASVFQGVL